MSDEVVGPVPVPAPLSLREAIDKALSEAAFNPEDERAAIEIVGDRHGVSVVGAVRINDHWEIQGGFMVGDEKGFRAKVRASWK